MKISKLNRALALSVLTFLSSLQSAWATDNAQITSRFDQTMRNIRVLEERKVVQFRSANDQILTFEDLLKNPNILSEVSLVSDEYPQVAAGFRLKMIPQVRGQQLSIRVEDTEKKWVLGRANIDLGYLSKGDPAAFNIQLQNTLKHLTAQVSRSLSARGLPTARIEKSGPKGLFQIVHKLFVPQANANGMLTIYGAFIAAGLYLMVSVGIVGLLMAVLVFPQRDHKKDSFFGKNPAAFILLKIIAGLLFVPTVFILSAIPASANN